MADITFYCPHCSQKLEAPEEGAGRSIACPTCSEQIQIPATEPPKEAPKETPEEAAEETPEEAAEGAPEKAAKEGGEKKWRLPRTQGARLGGRDRTRTQSRGAAECPECGASLATDAVLCVGCGLNLETGEKVRTDM